MGHAAKEHNKARTLALAFFVENAKELFGIDDLNNIREFNVSTDSHRGHKFTYLRFRQYVEDVKVDNSDIQMDIEDDITILRVHGGFILVTPELLKAVKGKTLSEEETRKIVTDDLNKVTSSLERGLLNDPTYEKIRKVEKVAISVPPYVAGV